MTMIIDLNQNDEQTWYGQYETEDDMNEITLEKLRFTRLSISGEWFGKDGEKFSVKGTISA